MKRVFLAGVMAVVMGVTGCSAASSQQSTSAAALQSESADIQSESADAQTESAENLRASETAVSSGEAAADAVPGESGAQDTAGAGQNGGMGGMTDYKKDDTVLQNMISTVVPRFRQFTYTDSETGKTVAYNLYIPEDYDASRSYPLVYYIADSSVVGQETTAPLTQGYGGIIWATDEEQAKHESFVLVPEYPEMVLDDHDGYQTTDYMEMTVRLLQSVESEYSVDTGRIYATGQSMGCMIFMYLAAEHPDLFAAELFVDGQWDITQLSGLESQKYFYFAAEGDSKASEGQKEVMDMLAADKVSYSTAEWDAGWTTDEFRTAVSSILAEGNTINCVQWKLGTVLPEGVSVGTSEHMYSFDHAYTTEGVRDWLFAQSK